jgi:hypothetical protein
MIRTEDWVSIFVICKWMIADNLNETNIPAGTACGLFEKGPIIPCVVNETGMIPEHGVEIGTEWCRDVTAFFRVGIPVQLEPTILEPRQMGGQKVIFFWTCLRSRSGNIHVSEQYCRVIMFQSAFQLLQLQHPCGTRIEGLQMDRGDCQATQESGHQSGPSHGHQILE